MQQLNTTILLEFLFLTVHKVASVTELLYSHKGITAFLHTFFNVTEGLQFRIRIIQPNYVSIWI